MHFLCCTGPSGAGKSSLLKCLTEGIGYSGFTGTIVSKGIGEKIRGSIIHQDEKEHLILGLTVMETLMYASKLKNRYWCPSSNFHEENVQELLMHLGLENKKNNPVSRCSGGERKRLAIGVELSEKRKPHILFLDEPSTGLDSSVAFSVSFFFSIFRFMLGESCFCRIETNVSYCTWILLNRSSIL